MLPIFTALLLSQGSFVPPHHGHGVRNAVPDLLIQCGDDFFLPLQEARPAQVPAETAVEMMFAAMP